MNKKTLMIIIGILSFIVIVGGISYSYFVYNKDVGTVSIETGEISLSLSDVSSDKTLTNVIPLSDIDGKNSSDYFDFTVDATVDSERIYYEVYLLPKSGNTLDTDYLKVYLTDQNNNEIKYVRYYNLLVDSEKENGKVIYKGIIELNDNQTTKNESKDFRLRMWLDETYTEQTSKTFEFDIYLYAKNVDNNFIIPEGANLMNRAILSKEAEGETCANISYVEDGITYLSGTGECVNMNYVWYSGKLWRITAIYPDGAMKLVTQYNISSLAFNSNNNNPVFYTDANTKSYVYDWLNEDFYDTLYNGNQFIDTTKRWNATMPADTNVSTKPLETNIITANVGLLNNYDFYNSYRCIGITDDETCPGTSDVDGYLFLGFYWWLLNPYSSNRVWAVSYSGASINYNANTSRGVRPSIVIKPGLEFTGEGTVDAPYRIIGDKETGEVNDLINTRLSGEYIKLKSGSNELSFRIIGVEGNKTKIIAMDHADNRATRKFATGTADADAIWGSGTSTDTDTWYTYLNAQNTGYFDTLRTTYGEFFDSGLYYLGVTGYNYKLGVCANTTSGSTKDCDKTTDVGTFNVGLPRYGEMFATPRKKSSVWLMNRYSLPYVWFIDSNGEVNYHNPTYEYRARTTLHLKSTVKIISGSGTESNPYVIGL